MFFACREGAGDGKYGNPEEVEKMDHRSTTLCNDRVRFIKKMVVRYRLRHKAFSRALSLPVLQWFMICRRSDEFFGSDDISVIFVDMSLS